MIDQQQVEESLAMPSYLERVVRFEQMLLEQSAAITSARGEQFNEVLQATLAIIGHYLGVDRAYIFRFDDERQTMSNTVEWCAPGVEPSIDSLQDLPQDVFPAWMATLQAGQEILIPEVQALPPSWAAEKESLEKQSIHSVLVLPMIADQRLFGFIGFDSVHPDASWSPESRRILKFFASNIASSWQNEIKRQDLLKTLEVASQMRQKAELASQEKSSFLSNMSHEIRTPMNAVIGVAHLLKNTELTAVQNRYVEIVLNSGQTILNIITSILDLSKIESGKFELDQSAFSLEDIFGNLDKMFQFPAEEKGLQVDYSIDPRVPAFLVGDPVRLQQILINLLSNAVKYSAAGQIHAQATLQDLRDERCWIQFTVSDQGIGLSADEINHLFDPFWQSGVGTKQAHHGSGLGLAIVKNLCELMGGQIDVQSEQDVGSRFTIALPFTLAKQANAFQPNLTLQRADRVLIIDDDLSSQRYLAKLLHAWSIKSAACKSFAEASQLIQTNTTQSRPFTIAVIGGQHLAGDGLEKVHQLRAQAPALHNVFVLAAPDSTLFLNPQLLTGLVDGFLTKPLKASVLSDELVSLLGHPARTSPNPEGQPGEQAAHYRFQNVRLLVVEDIAINREIIRALLQTFGIEAELARDGIMALEMAGSHAYDLILMDVQMPFMDGLEATRRIRALPDKQKSRVPILALTAHTMQTDRDACQDAGMNDHVIKPIDPEFLYDRLAKWLPHKLSPEPALAPAHKQKTRRSDLPNQSAEGSATIERSLFDPQAGLDLVGGNEEIFRSMLRNFMALYVDLPHQLDQLLAKGDRTGLSRICHNLKSTTGHAGSAVLSAQAHQLNQTIKTGAWPPSQETRQQLTQFGRDVVHLLNVISHYLETVGLPEQTVLTPALDPSREALVDDLKQLRHLLQDHDPQAARLILQHIQPSPVLARNQDKLLRIDKLLNQYQFDNALLVVEQLARLVFSDALEPWTDSTFSRIDQAEWGTS